MVDAVAASRRPARESVVRKRERERERLERERRERERGERERERERERRERERRERRETGDDREMRETRKRRETTPEISTLNPKPVGRFKEDWQDSMRKIRVQPLHSKFSTLNPTDPVSTPQP